MLSERLGFMALEPPSELQPLGLAQSTLVGALAGRDLDAHRERLCALAAGPVPPRADNRLRFVAGLRAAADLLVDLPLPELSLSELSSAVALVHGVAGLWAPLADLALAYALRVHGPARAADLWPLRAEATLGDDAELLTVLALALDGGPAADGWTAAEVGWLATRAATDMVGTARVATMLGLPRLEGGGALAASWAASARRWDDASREVRSSPPEWSLTADGLLALEIDVAAAPGSFPATKPSALAEIGHRLVVHLDRAQRGALPAAEVRRARRKADIAAALERGAALTVRLQGGEPSAEDLAALARRQEASLRWLRHRRPIPAPSLRVVHAARS